MQSFTLHQLLMAETLLFPADFKELWEKHTGNEAEAAYMTMLFKRQHKSRLLYMLSDYSSANREMLQVFTNIINDILSGKKD